MAHDRREGILAGIELREPSRRQIARHQREVPLSPEIVQQEAPFLLVIELEASRALDARDGAHIAADLRPIAQKRVGLLHDDILTARRQPILMRFRSLVLLEAEVGVTHLDSGSVDHTDSLTRTVPQLDPHLRLAERLEILGRAIVDTVRVIARRNLGGPEDQVLSARIVVDRLGRPCATRTIRRDTAYALFRPMDQVGGLPHHDRLATRGLGGRPITIAIDFQVRSYDIEFFSVRRAHDERVAQPLLAHGGDQDRVTIIEVGPM